MFPGSSVRKESACNAGDPSSIPGSGRSPGEGKGYPLQCSWASLMAQLVKNPPAVQETWIWSLGWEDSLEQGKATQLQYSGLENPRDCIVHWVAKSQTRLSGFHFRFHRCSCRVFPILKSCSVFPIWTLFYIPTMCCFIINKGCVF